MTLKSIILCITPSKPELTAQPWFRALNSHQGLFAYLRFAASISLAIHLIKAHKS